MWLWTGRQSSLPERSVRIRRYSSSEPWVVCNTDLCRNRSGHCAVVWSGSAHDTASCGQEAE